MLPRKCCWRYFRPRRARRRASRLVVWSYARPARFAAVTSLVFTGTLQPPRCHEALSRPRVVRPACSWMLAVGLALHAIAAVATRGQHLLALGAVSALPATSCIDAATHLCAWPSSVDSFRTAPLGAATICRLDAKSSDMVGIWHTFNRYFSKTRVLSFD